LKEPFLIFLALSSLTSFELKAQEADSTINIEYHIVDTTPEPKGGYAAIFEWFYDNLDESKLTGLDTMDCHSKTNRIFVQFIIDKTGQLIEPKIAKGIGSPYDEYCLELVSRMPIMWTPATYGGRFVNIRSVISFNFCQQEEQPESKNMKKRKRKKN